MSAIFGVFARQGPSPEAAVLETMAAAIPWYGDSGLWSAPMVALGQRSHHAGAETVLQHDHGRYAIVAHARLDNRQALLAELNLPASPARSDAQLILAAYQAWGEDSASHLLGDFAFAIWDEAAHKLVCARDQIGIAPFYLHLSAERLVFASDIRAVLAHPQVPDTLNDATIAQHLRYVQYVAPEMTFFAAVRKLRPARVLVVSADSISEREYWSPLAVPSVRLPNASAYAQGLHDLLQTAVSCRIDTNVPVAAHVSGGLDSSAIAVLAQQQLQARGQSLAGYSWLPTPRTSEEAAAAEYVATGHLQALGIHVDNVDLDSATVCAWLEQDIGLNVYTDLFYESLVRAQAKIRGIGVLLSGWGGDEVVSSGGRGYLAELFWRGRWLTLARHIRQRSRGQPRPWRHGLAQLYGQVWLPSLPQALRRWVPRLRMPDLAALTAMNSGFAATHANQSSGMDGLLGNRVGVQATQARFLQNGHLQMRIEAWAAQGAQDGIVYRYPLLDRRLLEFCLGAPADVFVHDSLSRPLFRLALAPILPDHIRLAHNKLELARVNHYISVLEAACQQWLATSLPACGAALTAAQRYFDTTRLLAPLPDAVTPQTKMARTLALARQIQVLILVRNHG